MSRPLKVPLFLQPITKPYCGPACIKMVLAFLGKNYSLEELVARLPMTSSGIGLYSIGMFLIAAGLKPKIFLNTKTAFIKNPAHVLDLAPFVKQGGLSIPRAIKIPDIRKAIESGHPVILNIASENIKNGGHYVVVKNIGKKRMTINDPFSGTKTQDIKRVMRRSNDWTGGAIIVEPN